ncbi:MAG: polyprenyl synthetase family protein [Candidatus Saccharimonadales bacterium]
MTYDGYFSVSDAQLRTAIDQDLAECATVWQAEFEGGSREPVAAFCNILLRGGKRLRGMLAMQSYYAHGGRDEHVAIVAARVFEFVQTYLLILDDIADRSDMRRGGLSAHKLLETYAVNADLKNDHEHYGATQAMNAAVAGMHKATAEILDLDIDSGIVRRALLSLHHNLAVTIDGQMNDIYNEVSRDIPTEDAIERVLTRKSAYYTILSPLELGACLAGKDGLSEPLHDYSIHTGCAFQITDDTIGSFGNKDQTGKGTNDDIHEGKMTLLVQYALKKGDNVQKSVLEATLGNCDASDADCDKVRDVLIATGAKDYAETRSSWHKDEAFTALDRAEDIDHTFIVFLHQLTDYITKRQS